MANLISQIDIEINPVYFIFSWKEYQRKVATLVGIDKDNKQLVAIGEKVADEDVASIALFAPEQDLPAGIERLDLLQTFLEYNIAKLFEKENFRVFKPKIVFHGEKQLNQILCGYQRSLLEIAALAAGAKEVVFD